MVDSKESCKVDLGVKGLIVSPLGFVAFNLKRNLYFKTCISFWYLH